MAFSHNTLTQCTIRFRQMLTIFASNQGHHAFGENYERAVVKKTERPSRLAHTKKWGNNSSTQPFRLNMTCFVVANCVEKFNNEIKKTRKSANDMKKTMNAGVLRIKTYLAKPLSMFMSADLFHSPNACVHCLV